jgi:hypothetical protein
MYPLARTQKEPEPLASSPRNQSSEAQLSVQDGLEHLPKEQLHSQLRTGFWIHCPRSIQASRCINQSSVSTERSS